MDLAALSRAVLAGRPELFVDDYNSAAKQLESAFRDRRVLVIGAGGSIGRATAELLLEHRPARTLLIDSSENNLVSVTRRLRNHFGADCPDFAAWPLDFTGPAFEALLEMERPEVLLNFAAYKHVRSERDQLSLAEMLRVNVIGNVRLVRWALENRPERVFAISTDKAANPANCMGASKRLMEMLLWGGSRHLAASGTCFTSTRFANVLFSDGSLPASFLERIQQRQPLSGPNDVERFFITSTEAARLCLLAASHPQSGELLVPRMGPADRLRFDVIAERLLSFIGLAVRHYGEDTSSAENELEGLAARGEWPCCFGPSTTSGEKEAEEFRQANENLATLQPYRQVEAVIGLPEHDLNALEAQLNAWQQDLSNPAWLVSSNKEDVVAELARLVPSFRHNETGQSLESKR